MVAPRTLLGPLGQRSIDQPEDQPELGVVDADDEQAARVMVPSGKALADEPGEVLDVTCHDDSLLASSELQQRPVLPAVERTLLVNGPDIVAELAYGRCDCAPGDVSVQQQPQT